MSTSPHFKDLLEPNCFYEVYRHGLLLGIAKFVVYQPDHRCLLWYFYDPEELLLPLNNLRTSPHYTQNFKKTQPKNFPLYAYLTATSIGEQWYKQQQTKSLWKRLLKIFCLTI